MAKKKQQRRRGSRAVIAIAVILALIIIALVVLYALGKLDPLVDKFKGYFSGKQPGGYGGAGGSNGGSPSDGYQVSEVLTGDEKEIAEGDLSIHFLYLGNDKAGDCTLIKVGDTEVLIDAGSRQSSASTLVPYIQKYCTDGVLEYVIATHADQDHIAAFVGTKTAPGVFDSFECKTIIDFARTNKTTQIYQNYCAKRDEEVEITEGSVHYTALECWNETNGAQRVYELSESISMNILYNYYYEYDSSDENNYSVCMLLSQKTEDETLHYLFTGDLEKEGEEKLVIYNELPHVKLFKAGHHGSPTSSNDCLLSVITPEIVCVCCCAGSTEYTTNKDNTFPSQAMIDRVGKYTSAIYVTTMMNGSEHELMNGNIVLYFGKSEDEEEKSLKLWCSNNATILKDTEWFSENRVWSGVA